MQTLIKCCFQTLWKWVMKALQLCLSKETNFHFILRDHTHTRVVINVSVKSTAICKWDFTVTCYQDRANIGSKKWTALVRVRSFEQSSLFKSEPRRTRKISKSKVTIAHVNAFFSFKLNAIIMFVIHIYYVPETYFTHSQRYGWISHYFMVSMKLENGRNLIFRTFWAKNFSFLKKNFIFTIRFLDHFKSFGTHSWRLFFEKCPCKFFFKFLPKSKVTIVHVHAFFYLKLNAIIIFGIHIYSVP